ncbi:MAG: hypothetical protein ACMUFK_01300 [Thermoplasmatota archaeon]
MATEMVEISNTGIAIVSALYNNTTSVLNLTLCNSGSSVMEISDIDVLLNGTYRTGATPSEGYLYPGQTRTLSMSNVTDPRSLKVIGPWGISDTTTSLGRG